MDVTISLDDNMVKAARKVAVERGTTLTGLVREFLEGLVRDDHVFEQSRREREALEVSFEKFQFRVGERTWMRADLHARS